MFTAIVCGWLGLVVSWPAIYWFGQQRRVKAVLPAAETMVAGAAKRIGRRSTATLPDIGPFLAYPVNAPTALLPLSECEVSENGVAILGGRADRG